MKICSNCGYENSDNGKFCSECGAKLQDSSMSCPECGTKVEPTNKFCPECGYNLMDEDAASFQDDESEDQDFLDEDWDDDFQDDDDVDQFERILTSLFLTANYNDLSEYNLTQLDLLETYIDYYADFTPEYKRSCRISVRNEIGKRYFMGDGVEVDKGKAFELFMKSASSGDPCAQFILGKCYEEGYGTEVKEQTAFKWYKKAAEQGIAEAQEALASCYTYGVGTKIDEDAAREWHEQAASQKDGNDGYVWWKFI